MNGKLLVVVDMQNDFLTGSLANPDGVKIIPNVVQLIKEWEGKILVTQDTHESNYEYTLEGKWLPFKHCIKPHAVGVFKITFLRLWKIRALMMLPLLRKVHLEHLILDLKLMLVLAVVLLKKFISVAFAQISVS